MPTTSDLRELLRADAGEVVGTRVPVEQVIGRGRRVRFRRRAAMVSGACIIAAVTLPIAFNQPDPAQGPSTGCPRPSLSTAPAAGDVVTAGDVTVNVYNATLRRGLAHETAAELASRGFDVAEVAYDPLGVTILGVGEIRAAASDSPEVEFLIQYAPGAVVVVDGRANRTVDLALGDAFTSLGNPIVVTPVPVPQPPC